MTNAFYMELIDKYESLKEFESIFKIFNDSGKRKNNDQTIQHFIDDNREQFLGNTTAGQEMLRLIREHLRDLRKQKIEGLE